MPRGLRVLVVDDNPQDRRLVVRELRTAYPDAEILEAVDQTQLDTHLNAVDFDVIVTDYHLQWSDGIRVLKAAKQRAPNCPVIMFTATGNEEVAVEAMKQGLDDYIIKNVKHLIRLRAAVQAVLEHTTTRRRANQLASRLDSLLSQLQVGVFTCSLDGQFLDQNDAMLRFLEVDFAPAANGNRRKSLGILFADEQRAGDFLRQVAAANGPQETEFMIRTSSSETKYFRLNARMVDESGETPRIDGLLEEVTRRKQTEAEAQQAAVAMAQLAMLSPREIEVLREVVAGHANKVVARHLHISDKTVEKHRSSLMKKLNVRSVAELVRLAMLAETAGR